MEKIITGTYKEEAEWHEIDHSLKGSLPKPFRKVMIKLEAAAIERRAYLRAIAPNEKHVLFAYRSCDLFFETLPFAGGESVKIRDIDVRWWKDTGQKVKIIPCV